MPRIGTPASNTACGACGAPGSVVDSGPPERMMPFAPKRAICAGSWSHARISQYTPSSRTRRAISCVYCAPKSRIRILSLWMFCTCGSIVHPVIRCFLRDLHVVHLRLAHAGAGHAHELRLAAHVVDGRAAAI